MENFQDMEVLVLNHVETPVEIQDMDIFQDLEAQHHTQYIVKPSVQENGFIDKFIKNVLTILINSF